MASSSSNEEAIALFILLLTTNEDSSFLKDEVTEQAQVIAINYTKSLLNKFVKDIG